VFSMVAALDTESDLRDRFMEGPTAKIHGNTDRQSQSIEKTRLSHQETTSGLLPPRGKMIIFNEVNLDRDK